MRYKRVVVTQYGGPEVITTTEEEIPIPGAGEVRVKILAAGVGLPDVLAREGVHPETPLLHRSAKARAGQRMLIHGAAGGVGSAMLQLAKLAGVEMYGTCSAEGAAVVRQLGGIPID